MTWPEPELPDGLEEPDRPLDDELPDDLVLPDLAEVEPPELAELAWLELADLPELAGWEVLVFADVVLAAPGRL